MTPPRYSIALILMVTLVGCAVAASAHYLVKGLVEGGRRSHLTFLLFSMAGPVLLMVVVSFLSRFWNRKP
jgi:hypothetical protein